MANSIHKTCQNQVYNVFVRNCPGIYPLCGGGRCGTGRSVGCCVGCCVLGSWEAVRGDAVGLFVVELFVCRDQLDAFVEPNLRLTERLDCNIWLNKVIQFCRLLPAAGEEVAMLTPPPVEMGPPHPRRA